MPLVQRGASRPVDCARPAARSDRATEGVRMCRQNRHIDVQPVGCALAGDCGGACWWRAVRGGHSAMLSLSRSRSGTVRRRHGIPLQEEAERVLAQDSFPRDASSSNMKGRPTLNVFRDSRGNTCLLPWNVYSARDEALVLTNVCICLRDIPHIPMRYHIGASYA